MTLLGFDQPNNTTMASAPTLTPNPTHSPTTLRNNESSEATKENNIYRIYDYFSPSDPETDFTDGEQWKDEIKNRLGNTMIVDWSHYTTPLETLGSFGKIARSIPLQHIGYFSRNFGLFHKFLVFKLKKTSEPMTNLPRHCKKKFKGARQTKY